LQTSNDVGTLSIGGASFLASFDDVQWSCDPEFEDWQNGTRLRKGVQPMKNMAKLVVPSRPIKTGQTRISHMDLSVATLVSQNIKPELESLTLKIANPVNPIPNIGEFMRRYQVDPGGSITADLALRVADSASVSLALLDLLESTAVADLAGTLSFTLNGVAITVPGFLRRGGHSAPAGQQQKVTLGFEGSDNDGTYPAAPTGTSTVLERALNAPKTALAFTFISKTVGGLSRTGFVLIEGWEIAIEDGKIVRETGTFVVSEPWVTVVTSA
jgi:hypothetical protein